MGGRRRRTSCVCVEEWREGKEGKGVERHILILEFLGRASTRTPPERGGAEASCRREASALDLHSSWQGGKINPFLRTEQQQKVGLNTNKQASQNRRTQKCDTANQTILPCPGMLRTAFNQPRQHPAPLDCPLELPKFKTLCSTQPPLPADRYLRALGIFCRRIPASRRLKQDERSRRHCQKAEPGGCRLSQTPASRHRTHHTRARSVTQTLLLPGLLLAAGRISHTTTRL